MAIRVDGDFPERGEPSTPISVDLVVEGDASDERLREVVDLVDRIAEIPKSSRGTTPIDLRSVRIAGSDSTLAEGGRP